MTKCSLFADAVLLLFCPCVNYFIHIFGMRKVLWKLHYTGISLIWFSQLPTIQAWNNCCHSTKWIECLLELDAVSWYGIFAWQNIHGQTFAVFLKSVQIADDISK